jgi:hypothetical protein
MSNKTSIRQTAAEAQAQTQQELMTQGNSLKEDILVELRVISLLLNEGFNLKEDLDALRVAYK